MFTSWMETKMESPVKADLNCLQEDHNTLSQLLTARRTVSMETLPVGARLLWGVYLTILDDALITLTSLIDYLSPRS